MPSKKRKYNARFPAGRIKRIMQADEEVGKIAQAVPVIISRTLELFVESLLTKSSQITISRNAKTLSPTHLKQCIMSESRFDFLKDLVKNIPDITIDDTSTTGIASEDQQFEQQLSASSHNGTESNGSHQKIYQRSQSLQPSTSQQQYHNTLQQQKQFHLNNYTTTNHHTKPNPNISHLEYQRPSSMAKIVRINSTPAPTSTITSEQLHQNLKQNKQSLTLPEFPIQISYNIDESSTSTQSPTVKIDYSKLSMPATSPSIKIDLSSYSSAITSIQPSTSSNNNNASSGLDEDYDA